MKAKYVRVDSYPCSKSSVLDEPANIENCSKKEMLMIKNLKIGETILVGMNIVIEGIDEDVYRKAIQIPIAKNIDW